MARPRTNGGGGFGPSPHMQRSNFSSANSNLGSNSLFNLGGGGGGIGSHGGNSGIFSKVLDQRALMMSSQNTSHPAE
jgi:hypothetical protein